MTLAELHDALVPSFPPSMRKDLQTAVRVLAQALHCPNPQHCALEQYNQSLPSFYQQVETYLLAQGKGPHTVRNTKNNLSRLFRLAEQQQLFSLQSQPLTPRFTRKSKPWRPGYTPMHHGTSLVYRHWPLDLQDAYSAFVTWATAPVVPGRDASLRKRPITMTAGYQLLFEGYFGYLHHILHIPVSFEHLFDLSLVTNYVHWHINDLHKHPTIRIQEFLTKLIVMTRQYRPLPELRTQLIQLRKTIPQPPPRYNKEDAWVPLATLDIIGHALWPQKQPKDISASPGSNFALHAGLSLMLRLWTYIPLRQRNVREMLLGEHLHQDSHGTWRLTFRGDQLKIAMRHGKPNVFDVPFPEKLIPVLQDYLVHWRPILLAKAPKPETHVFLTRSGTPYSLNSLIHIMRDIVYSYTGKHWHPHMIRTVWATEWIRNTHGDLYTAAVMLNDKLETVITSYAHLLEEDVAEKAYRLIEERISQGR